MRNVGFLFAMGLLLTGASRCDRHHGNNGHGTEDGGVSPGDPPPTSPQCGGIAGEGCPGAGQCVDDPSDDCDPEQGGADCGGMCVCNALGLCVEGMIWNEDPSVCGCEPDGGGEAGSGGGGGPCGPVDCDEGQVCCNESCGICTEPGGFCTEQFCEPDAGPGPDPSAPHCGGITGEGCPGAGMCADDPSDDCDPENGGADCGGLCTCSGAAVLCLEGTFFNDDPAICACEPQDGGGVPCGPSTCAEGQVCCNESCGICTEPDGACTQQFCEPPDGGTCDMTCDAGQHCELVDVVCVQAPCPPLPECVDSPFCGGIAGFACPGEGECLDAPDSCDPENGGADCGGYCECNVGPLIDCADGRTFDPSPEVCACVEL
jgi:hypothetical protein